MTTKILKLLAASLIGLGAVHSASADDFVLNFQTVQGLGNYDESSAPTGSGATTSVPFSSLFTVTQGLTIVNPGANTITPLTDSSLGSDAARRYTGVVNNETNYGTLADSISQGSYVSFKIAKNNTVFANSYTINFTNLLFTARGSDAALAGFGGSTSNINWINPATNVLVSGDSTNAGYQTLSGATNAALPSGGRFDNITGEYEFRFYVTDSANFNTTTYFSFESIDLEGTFTPVPEPSQAIGTLACAMLGGFVTMRRGRRRRRESAAA